MNKAMFYAAIAILFILPSSAFAERKIYFTGGDMHGPFRLSIVNPSEVDQRVQVRVVATGNLEITNCRDGYNSVPVGTAGKECVNRTSISGPESGESLNMTFAFTSSSHAGAGFHNSFYIEITVREDEGFLLGVVRPGYGGRQEFPEYVMQINGGKPF